MPKSRLSLKLEAMAYPYPFDLDRLEFPHFQKLVVWLEDTQIRSLPEDQRVGLRAAVAPQAWWPTFVDYCKSLGYRKPLPLPKLEGPKVVLDNNFRTVVDWLVGRAIRFFYAEDEGAAKYNAAHAQWIKRHKPLSQQLGSEKPGPTSDALALGSAVFTIEDPQKFDELVGQLCDALSLKRTGDLSADLTFATRMVKQLVAIGAGKAPAAKTTEELLEDIPLGFSTGDPKLDIACKLLRVLYTADLRELQDAIDETLIRLQNITGDPKTDTRLGKVGS